MKLYESIKPLREKTYLHINNGGITVGMEHNTSGDNCLKIEASHMGAKTNGILLPITKSALRGIILDLVDELAKWSSTPNEYGLQSDVKKDMIIGDVAKAVADIIGYPDAPEEMSEESFTPDKNA